MGHSVSVEPNGQGLSRLTSFLQVGVNMDEAGNFDVGVAGSLTMICLTLAMVFLMISFYRGYKRLIDRKDQE